jgi:hypothetical protein
LFALELYKPNFAGGRVPAYSRSRAARSRPGVGGVAIDHPSFARAGWQRYVGARMKISDHAFDVTPWSCRSDRHIRARTYDGVRSRGRRSCSDAAQAHGARDRSAPRARFVVQDLARNTAKIVTPTRDGQVALQSLIGDEFHIGRPAPAERHYGHRPPIAPAPMVEESTCSRQKSSNPPGGQSNGLGYPVKKTGREVPLRGLDGDDGESLAERKRDSLAVC